ncbi:prepilin-type N-terminal cleavage/methylation domain-containing protein [Duganella sp. FT3S]|uniref:Prepilin-type N-terminal cleavage/methylation domain-containing protein n=1 Tax=Rugamonas fusca TaxID=2758568 RepID=A0A7W2EKC4_9BURK|nr:type IV pilin protein [Rugamonas fusca]MBA5607509.1 prepilin-type N-terminal cleavage/methylation domain-containing protein [Rugamonas fusca]
MKRVKNGFTLIEVLVTVVIVGILMAVAMPAYNDYVIRGRLTEAFSALGTAQPAAEQFWSNNRTYVGFDTAINFPAATANFTYALSGASASAYTVTATGIGKVAGFVYTIDQNGTRATTGSPAGWGTSTSCWVDHKGGSCSN